MADGFHTPSDAPLPQRLHAIHDALKIPWTPIAFKSHSDANLLQEAGCRSIIMGPGQLAKAHTRDESVSFAQVTLAARLYAQLLAAI